MVAEVVVTPARRAKRKAQDAASNGHGTGGASASKRSMHLRSRGPVQTAERERLESPLTSGACRSSSSVRNPSLTDRAVPSSVADADAEGGGAASFEDRLAAAQGDDAYVRSRLALLVDMARTAEMRLADVLGRVAELETANQRLERMVVALTSANANAPPSPKRK